MTDGSECKLCGATLDDPASVVRVIRVERRPVTPEGWHEVVVGGPAWVHRACFERDDSGLRIVET